MDDIYRDILSSMLGQIKNTLFPQYIDYEEFEQCKQHWNNPNYKVFRPDADCSCTDDGCPHKSIVSILAVGCISRYCYEHCIKIKGEGNLATFNPHEFEIHEDFKYDKDSCLWQGNFCKIKGYFRFYVNNVVIDKEYKPDRSNDVLEGIIFHDKIPQWIEFDCNRYIVRFQIEGDRFMPDNFFLPLCEMGFTQLFITASTPTNCTLLYGFLQGNRKKCEGKRKFTYNKKNYILTLGHGQGLIHTDYSSLCDRMSNLNL